MITLHRLARHPEPMSLNPDLIFTIEAHPDTVLTLTTGQKVLVCESPVEVADAIRAWRASILTSALRDSGMAGSSARRVERHGMALASSPPPNLPNAEETGAMADHRSRYKP